MLTNVLSFLQRVNQCLRDACRNANLTGCMELIDCNSNATWRNDKGANDCLNFSSGVFSYGIYANVVPLTIETRVISKYVYALFWGFQVCIL